MDNEELFEQLGELIDDLDNCACALKIPMGSEVHVAMLKKLLPEKVKKFKKLYIKLTGENPWK